MEFYCDGSISAEWAAKVFPMLASSKKKTASPGSLVAYIDGGAREKNREADALANKALDLRASGEEIYRP